MTRDTSASARRRGETIALTRDPSCARSSTSAGPSIVHRLVYADSLAEAAAAGATWAVLPRRRRVRGRLAARAALAAVGRLPSGSRRQLPIAVRCRRWLRRLSILMPVFNELATVEAAIDDALTAELPVDARQLVIVDDGSTDGTPRAARLEEAGPPR